MPRWAIVRVNSSRRKAAPTIHNLSSPRLLPPLVFSSRQLMSLILRTRLLTLGALAGAVWLAWELASGDYLWPALVTVIALCASLVFVFGITLDALVIGGLMFGYLVGNRGFAQLMPSAQLPLLPAEIGLMLAGGWLLVQFARERILPFRRDLLNACILGWIIAGSVRVLFDIRPFGFVALRDYAMIYYASFFFIAQHAAGGNSRRFLLRMLLAASIVQPIAVALVEAFPEFFLTKFTVRGIPLIFFKGDLAQTFTASSAFLLFFLTRGFHRLWAWPLATAELLYVISSDNRASMLGALAALGWLAFSRARRFVWTQAAVMAAALFILSAAALLTENRWARLKFAGMVERAASIGDFTGQRAYSTEESGTKGDNNRFRTVWWRTVIEDALDQNPVFGLGFGYDLARNFLREYNPDMAEDFTARSPHSIVVSTFGRMGFVGLAFLLGLIAVLVVRTWRIIRTPDVSSETLGIWAAIWVILVSACFGVVLEGPMGAVVFWSLLGIGCTLGLPPPPATDAEIAPPRAEALQVAEAHAAVLVSQTRTT